MGSEMCIRDSDVNDTVDKITPVTGTQNAIGVDFHYEKQLIYWTDVSKDSISRISIQGNKREDIIPSGIIKTFVII